MDTASQNERLHAGKSDREQGVVARLSHWPRKQWAHVRELVSLLEEAEDEGERVETTKTLLEVLFPKSLGGIGALDSGVEPEARERVDAYRKKVGRAIRKRREAVGMTQERLAELARIPQSHVSRLECGKHAPAHLTIQRIAAALKTRPSDLDPGFEDEADSP